MQDKPQNRILELLAVLPWLLTDFEDCRHAEMISDKASKNMFHQWNIFSWTPCLKVNFRGNFSPEIVSTLKDLERAKMFWHKHP